ncbi:MAG: amidohydrolase family protein [Flexilinea sp.]
MKTSESFSIIHGHVLTMDNDNSYYPDGMVSIQGKRIKYVGPFDETKTTGTIIDMTGKLVLPGLVNTHAHSGSALFRSLADDLFLMDWLQNYMWPAEKLQTEESAYIASALTHLEFLQNGITTNADMWYFPNGVARAVLESGLRTLICTTVFTNGSPETADTLKVAADFVEKYKDRTEETRIYPAYGPHAIYTCSQDTLRQIADLAKRDNVLIHTHISETPGEQPNCIERLGMTPTQAMENVGIFENHVLAAHCIYLSDADCEIFRKNKAAISYNPVSNLKLCSGIIPLEKMFKYDIRVSIGTDGPQSNNSLDLLRDLKIGSLIQKNRLNDPRFFPAEQAVRMATIDGAKALGLEKEIGSLEVGKRADIITLDSERAAMVPLLSERPQSLYAQVVYAASGANVSDVFVDGECLLRNRMEQRVNHKDILTQAQDMASFFVKRNGL